MLGYGRVSSHLVKVTLDISGTWWRHQMETFSTLLDIYAGNLPVTGEFLEQRPATCSFDVFFDLRPNKRLSKQSWGWWFETPLRPLWRYCNGATMRLQDISRITRQVTNLTCWGQPLLRIIDGKVDKWERIHSISVSNSSINLPLNISTPWY